MVWNHPAICKINAFLKLNRDHLGVNLNDDTLQPITDTFICSIVVTKYLHTIPHLIGFL
jgi:hypothetical protein